MTPTTTADRERPGPDARATRRGHSDHQGTTTADDDSTASGRRPHLTVSLSPTCVVWCHDCATFISDSEPDRWDAADAADSHRDENPDHKVQILQEVRG